jgi:hypothetical protein
VLIEPFAPVMLFVIRDADAIELAIRELTDWLVNNELVPTSELTDKLLNEPFTEVKLIVCNVEIDAELICPVKNVMFAA